MQGADGDQESTAPPIKNYTVERAGKNFQASGGQYRKFQGDEKMNLLSLTKMLEIVKYDIEDLTQEENYVLANIGGTSYLVLTEITYNHVYGDEWFSVQADYHFPNGNYITTQHRRIELDDWNEVAFQMGWDGFLVIC